MTPARGMLARLTIGLTTCAFLSGCGALGGAKPTALSDKAAAAAVESEAAASAAAASAAAASGGAAPGAAGGPEGAAAGGEGSSSAAGGKPPARPGTRPATTKPAVGGAGALPACMVGTWTAPAAREAQQQNLAAKSNGAIGAVRGTVRMVYAAKTFTFTYEKVSFEVKNAGTAKVTGSLSGTYTLTGKTLKSKIGKSDVKVAVDIGGSLIPVDEAFNGLATGMAPTNVTITCQGTKVLAFTQPDGTTVTFDKS